MANKQNDDNNPKLKVAKTMNFEDQLRQLDDSPAMPSGATGSNAAASVNALLAILPTGGVPPPTSSNGLEVLQEMQKSATVPCATSRANDGHASGDG